MKDDYKYFKIEASELLEELTKGLLQLEKRFEDQELIQDLFRHAHTLKGAASVVKLSIISTLAHKVEDLFALFRDHGKRASSEDITLLLEVVEVIRKILEAIKEGNPEDSVDTATVLKKLEGKVEGEGRDSTRKSETMQGVPEAPGKDHLEIPEKALTAHLSEHHDDPEINPRPKTGPINNVVSNSGDIPPPQQQEHSAPQDKHHAEHTRNKQQTAGRDGETIRIEARSMDKLTNLSGEIMLNNSRMKDILEHFLKVTRQSRKFVSKYIEMTISEISQYQEQFHKQLQDTVDNLEQGMQRMDLLYYEMNDLIMTTRLVSVKNFTYLFEKAVRDLAVITKKHIDFEIKGAELLLDRALLDQVKEPIYHLLRNSVIHGLELPSERVENGKKEAGLITLRFDKIGSKVKITCQDDGRGIDCKEVREIAVKKNLIDQNRVEEMPDREVPYLILKSGFSSAEILTELSGRGVGLDVVKNSVGTQGGFLRIESERGVFTRFEIYMPLSVNVTDAFLVEVSGHNLFIPLRNIVETCLLEEEEIASEAGRKVMQFNGAPIPLLHLADLLNLEHKADTLKKMRVVIIKGNVDTAALVIDGFKGKKRILPKPLTGRLKNIPCLLSATVLGNGDPAFVLNMGDIFERIRSQSAKSTDVIPEESSKSILVVDDSLTTRSLVTGVLEVEGYQVSLAESGEEALEILERDSFNLIITDVEMPGISGFELSEKIRQSQKDKETPIVILSSLANEQDKRRGIAVGANAYFVKGSFEHAPFLEMVETLV